MRPLLFDANNNQYADVINSFSEESTIGYLGILDATKCEVTEERNGSYELYLEYPISGKYILDLIPGNLIAVFLSKPRPSSSEYKQSWQFFEIYNVQRNIDSLSVDAHHISYELSWKYPRNFYTTTNIQDAMLFSCRSDYEIGNPFSGVVKYGDSSLFPTASFGYKGVQSCRQYLGGTEGSVLDTYGGELEWDNLRVIIHYNRGVQSGYKISYGKNLHSFEQEINNLNNYNCAYAFVEKDGQTVSCTYCTRESSGGTFTPEKNDRWAILDLSEHYTDQQTLPTQAQLKNYLKSYMSKQQVSVLDVSLSLDYVDIEKEELFRVKLCDIVTVYFRKYNLSVDLKVVRVVYDVLKERNISIELNQPKQTLADTIAQLQTNQKKMGSLQATANANRAAAQAANILLGNEQEER